MNTVEWLRNQWDRALAIVLALLGLLALYLGWRGVSTSTLPTEQLPYLVSGGLIGLFLLGVGGTLWLSADLRDDWRKLDEVNASVVRNTEMLESMSAATASREESAVPDADPVAANGRRRNGRLAAATSQAADRS